MQRFVAIPTQFSHPSNLIVQPTHNPHHPPRNRRLLKLGGPDPTAARAARRAIVISTSVKTLPVAVTVLTKLGPALGEAVVGIAMLPVVFYQLTQIMWESVMVSQWLAADSRALRGDEGASSAADGSTKAAPSDGAM